MSWANLEGLHFSSSPRTATLSGRSKRFQKWHVQRSFSMIDGFPLSFFLPLVVHALAALTTGVTGVITFSQPKRSVRHPTWGRRYLWAYTVVFLTAIALSVQHWPTDAYLVVLATLGYGAALG